jgi:hypothetical protein
MTVTIAHYPRPEWFKDSDAPGCCARANDGQLAELAGDSNPNLLFTRQARIVHGVLARAVLAAHVGSLVQPVRSCEAE